MKQPDTKTVNRVVLSSLIGATIEWYDFFLYGVMAGIVLNKLFFPADDPTTSLLLTYATFAVGFLTRPIGGIVFGHFGDRVGRKSVLVATLMIMGVSTVAIGLIPTYAQIGVWAPALLLLMRILQGIGLGGEWGGASLMVLEHSPHHRRGLYGSLVQVGFPIGLILSAAVEPELLYTEGPLCHEFPRTASRLQEMQTAAYLGSTRRNVDTTLT